MLITKKKTHDEAVDEELEGVSIDDLLRNRINEIRAFSIALKNDNLLAQISSKDSDELFTDLLSLAVNDYGVSRKQLAEAVDANVATVGGWCSGRSVPPPYARKSILTAVAFIIDHDLLE